MADADWDLYAVVRSCCCSTASSSSSAATSSSTTTTNSLSLENHHQQLFPLPDPFDYRPTESSASLQIHDLQDLFKPFPHTDINFINNFNNNSNNNNTSSNSLLPISPLSVLGGIHDVSPPQTAAKTAAAALKKHCALESVVVTQSNRTKRRKVQMKKVREVAAEDLASDTWSWRKYGQKPIKGSPYPRGYYKCSTSKGCPARKQVERNKSDAGMFIVTYTGEHNHQMPTHRNTLAGTSRHKPEPAAVPNELHNKPSPEKTEDLVEVDEEEEDEFGTGSDMAVSDDFFDGLEDFTGPGIGGDCVLSQFSVSLAGK